MATRPKTRNGGEIVLDVLTNVVVFAAGAWALMILAGVVHAEVSAAVAPFGYGTALILFLLGDIVYNVMSSLQRGN